MIEFMILHNQSIGILLVMMALISTFVMLEMLGTGKYKKYGALTLAVCFIVIPVNVNLPDWVHFSETGNTEGLEMMKNGASIMVIFVAIGVITTFYAWSIQLGVEIERDRDE